MPTDASYPRPAWLGGAILVFALLATAGGAGAPTLPLAGALAWLLAPILFAQLEARARRPVVGLLVLGGGMIVAAVLFGRVVRWEQLLTQNMLLIAMLACVTFLQLVAPAPAAPAARLVSPLRRLLNVAAAVHVLGAVINLSMVVIASEQLSRRVGALPEVVGRVMARAFLVAALWSPFFAAMAVALTYAPGARLPEIALIGVPTAALLILLSCVEALRRLDSDARQQLPDYPLTLRLLGLPATMALAVAVLHEWRAQWAMLTVINATALGLPLLLLSWRAGRGEPTLALLRHHVSERLPMMRGEFLLFLAAAVFGTGLEAWLADLSSIRPFDAVTWPVAASLLAAMIVLASFGVHAVITITAVSALCAPLQPDPVVMALVFLGTWGLGLAVNPLSGVHLLLQGRFGLSAWRLARGNWPYVALGYAVVVAAIGARFAWMSAAHG